MRTLMRSPHPSNTLPTPEPVRTLHPLTAALPSLFDPLAGMCGLAAPDKTVSLGGVTAPRSYILSTHLGGVLRSARFAGPRACLRP